MCSCEYIDIYSITHEEKIFFINPLLIMVNLKRK